MALLIIMTAVLFVNQTSNKSQKEVEVAARQIAAQLRLLQNDSINGKYIDGQVYKFTFKAEKGKTAYNLEYEYNPSEGNDPKIELGLELNSAKKNVIFKDDVEVSFSLSSRGKTDPGSTAPPITLTAKNDTNKRAYVCYMPDTGLIFDGTDPTCNYTVAVDPGTNPSNCPASDPCQVSTCGSDQCRNGVCVYDGSKDCCVQAVTATGQVEITEKDGREIYTFTGDGEINVSCSPVQVGYLVVGGGGGGGTGPACSGGGAGGFLTGTTELPAGSTSITVGDGGLAGVGVGYHPGNKGENSSVGSIIIAEGGGYGVCAGNNGGSGGSGGGGGILGRLGGTGTQGNNGGNGCTCGGQESNGGGGGGAGEVGDIGRAYDAADGGDGLPSFIRGQEEWYAGGGAGHYMNDDLTLVPGQGGKGGGGNDSNVRHGYPLNHPQGWPNTGGGGAGTYSGGGDGGSGIVIISVGPLVCPAIDDTCKGKFVYDSNGTICGFGTKTDGECCTSLVVKNQPIKITGITLSNPAGNPGTYDLDLTGRSGNLWGNSSIATNGSIYKTTGTGWNFYFYNPYFINGDPGADLLGDPNGLNAPGGAFRLETDKITYGMLYKDYGTGYWNGDFKFNLDNVGLSTWYDPGSSIGKNEVVFSMSNKVGPVRNYSYPGYEPGEKITVSSASPCVITLAQSGANPIAIGMPIYLHTTGALPAGLSVDTPYYVIPEGFTGTSFEISATPGGPAINTTGTQSGNHSFTIAPDTQESDLFGLTWYQSKLRMYVGGALVDSIQLERGSHSNPGWNWTNEGTRYWLTITRTEGAPSKFRVDIYSDENRTTRISTTSALGTAGYMTANLPSNIDYRYIYLWASNYDWGFRAASYHSFGGASDNSMAILSWGGGTTVDVTKDGTYTLDDGSGNKIDAAVNYAGLPGNNQTDSITVECQ